MNTIIGYGSLINPLSLVARYINYDFTEVYESDHRLFDELRVTELQRVWDDLDIECHPVTVTGFKRLYSIEHRGGGMLEVYPDEDEAITAIVYTDVPDDVYEAVADTESMHSVCVVNESDIFPYTDFGTLPEDTEFMLFGAGKDIPNTSVRRHPVYHDRIIEAHAFLIEDGILSVEDSVQFLRDFLKMTYEFDEDSGEWVTLYQADGELDIHRFTEYLDIGESYFGLE